MKDVQHWSGMQEAGSAMGIRIMLTLHKYFGRLPFYIVLLPVVSYFVLAKPASRHASLDFWSRLHPDANLLQRYMQVILHFWNFANGMLDKLLAASGKIALDKVKTSGREVLHQQVASGQGAVVLASHHGSIEICKALGQSDNIKFTAIVHTDHAANFNKVLSEITGEKNVELLPVKEFGIDTALILSQKIEAGNLIIIAADRIPIDSGRTLECMFFGSNAHFPQGPFILASLLKCPVFFMFSYRINNSFYVSVEKAYEKLTFKRGARMESIGQAMQKFADHLEVHVRKAPKQWFNFYPFWGLK